MLRWQSRCVRRPLRAEITTPPQITPAATRRRLAEAWCGKNEADHLPVANEGDAGTTDMTIHPLLSGIECPQHITIPPLLQQLAPLPVDRAERNGSGPGAGANFHVLRLRVLDRQDSRELLAILGRRRRCKPREGEHHGQSDQAGPTESHDKPDEPHRAEQGKSDHENFSYGDHGPTLVGRRERGKFGIPEKNLMPCSSTPAHSLFSN